MQKHNLNEVDKSGFPINDKGEQVPLFDSEGNAVLLLNSNLIMTSPKVYIIKFNPKDKLAVSKGLDSLVNKLTNKFDENLKGEFSLDFTREAKTKYNIFTKEPLIYPIVQLYFNWINGWLNYLGNCYNIEFKVLFYTKFKEKIKNNFIALKTGLNKHGINKKYLEFAEIWLNETDRNIELEEKIKSKTIPQSKNKTQNVEPRKQHQTFEDLFYNVDNAKPCLGILRDLDVINSRNEYIFKNKGIIPLWLKLLKTNTPALVKHLSDKVCVKILNKEIKNLKLTSDASEFRKHYSRIADSNYELQIKSLISQLSQDGKLGK